MEVSFSVSKSAIEEEIESSGSHNYLDHIPDHLLLLVFGKVSNAKSLTRCLSVSKRFASLIPQTDVVSLSVSPPRPPPEARRRKLSPHGILVNFFKPLVKFLSPKSHSSESDPNPPGLSCRCPLRFLKTFTRIKYLQLELPNHGGAVAGIPYVSGSNFDSDLFLKWNASFGADLKSCEILCATSSQLRVRDSDPKLLDQRQEQCHSSSRPNLTNEELKSRILWTISCLIAASTRHYWSKQFVTKFPDLERLEITDSEKQGRLRMEEEELAELRDSLKENTNSPSLLTERSVIPDLRMKMWYEKEIELVRSGRKMTGATLLVIRPGGKAVKEEKGLDILNGGLGFDGDDAEKAMVGEALREIVKRKKNYVLEMTSL